MTGAPANLTAVPVLPPGPLAAYDCQLEAHNVPVPMDQVAAVLPAGFEAQPYQNTPGLVPMANLVLLVGHCASIAGDVNVTDVGESMLYLAVNPPAAYMDDSLEGYRLVVAHVTDSPDLIGLYAKWNLTVGLATVSMSERTPQVTLVDASVSGPYQLSSRAQAAGTSASAATKLRYFYAVDGELQGATDRQLQATATQFVGPVTYQLSGAPLGNGNGGGYTAHYDWGGLDAFTTSKAELPPG